jgi:DEAD/DEAH box helicase domain-containing protein
VIDQLVRDLRQAATRWGRQPPFGVVHEQHLPGRPWTSAVLEPRLPRALSAAVRAGGVERLYLHQVEAIQAARAGRDVVVTTPTASGKSLCFNLPVLERALVEPGARALYVYPTKALMADQLRALESLIGRVGDRRLSARILDGDTPHALRAQLAADPPTVLLANPDVLHHALLANPARWRALLGSLAFVVLDELHAYRGAFGTHVALILRRLLRLAARAGAQPRVVAASATIANPAELAEQLVGRPFAAVRDESVGAHPRRFLLWRPPSDASPEDDAALVFAELMRQGRPGLLFGRTRDAVERMLLRLRAELDPTLASAVASYTAAYVPAERRRIEQGLRDGSLRGVVTTNALELGIDVGQLDAVVLAGYPGSVMSAWQQAGRAGRRGDQALVVLVGANDPLDQYYLNHPAAFFDQVSEHAAADPANEVALLDHLLCAAHEAPLVEADLAFFPPTAEHVLDRLESAGLVSPAPHRPLGEAAPHRDLQIRGIGREQYAVLEGQRQLATTEPPRLFRERYPGAVFLHQGRRYRVAAIDQTAKTVRVQPELEDVRTEPLAELRVAPDGDPARSRRVPLGDTSIELSLGVIAVEESVRGYRERPSGSWKYTNVPFATPYRSVVRSTGVWLDLPPALAASPDALHAVEHALVNVLPLDLLCDRRDLGSSTDVGASPGGRVYLFDAYEGGIGLTERAYRLFESLLRQAHDLVAACGCREGCHACIFLGSCFTRNRGLDKAGCRALLAGRRLAPYVNVPGVVRGPAAVRPAGPAPSLVTRLATDLRRERLARWEPAVGDRADWSGHEVEVLELRGSSARVRYASSPAESWVPLAELEPRRA